MTAHLPLSGLIALAPAPDGIWYIRSDGIDGWIGRADPTAAGDEERVGPAPMALATEEHAVYVAEGRPDEPGPQRVDVVEKLDPSTLEVQASASFTGLATDMIVTEGKVWVTMADGTLRVFDDRRLSPVAETRFEGSGPSHLATWYGFVWVLAGEIDDAGNQRTLLHRIDGESFAVRSTTLIPGTAGVSALSGGTAAWAATGSSAPGAGRVFLLDASGAPATSFGVPTATAIAATDESLWWVSGDGQVGMVRPADGEQRRPLQVGTGSTDIALSAGLVWVASDDLVIVRPSP